MVCRHAFGSGHEAQDLALPGSSRWMQDETQIPESGLAELCGNVSESHLLCVLVQQHDFVGRQMLQPLPIRVDFLIS